MRAMLIGLALLLCASAPAAAQAPAAQDWQTDFGRFVEVLAACLNDADNCPYQKKFADREVSWQGKFMRVSDGVAVIDVGADAITLPVAGGVRLVCCNIGMESEPEWAALQPGTPVRFQATFTLIAPTFGAVIVLMLDGAVAPTAEPTLRERTWLQGRVVTADGAPAGGVTVSAEGERLYLSGKSEVDGRFALLVRRDQVLPAAMRYFARDLSPTPRFPRTFGFGEGAPRADIVLTLQPAGTAIVSVVGADGKPASGVRVSAKLHDFLALEGASVPTDRSGNVTLTLPQGVNRVSAWRGGRLAGEADVEVRSGAESAVTVPLARR